MTSHRNYRVLTLAVAFIAVCVVVVIYLPAVRESAQGDVYKAKQDATRSRSPVTLPKVKDTLPIQPPMFQEQISQQAQDQGDANKDTLLVANFDDNWKKWKEDISLTNLRNYGLEATQEHRRLEETFPDPCISQEKAWIQDHCQNKERLLKTRFAKVENIPDEATLKTYSAERLSAIYYSYLDNTDIICHRKLRVGDGGWEICDDYEWRPVQPCIIYSFGIGNDFSFDNQSGFIYGCDVYSFDTSMRSSTYTRSDRVMFYYVGIGGKSSDPKTNNGGLVLHSFSNIRQMLNHTKKVIDVVKMDVERAEWPSLTTMVKEQQLDNVRQLLVEFHQVPDTTSDLLDHLILLHELERIGLRKFYVSKDYLCQRTAAADPIMRTSCYEIHFVNDKFRKISL